MKERICENIIILLLKEACMVKKEDIIDVLKTIYDPEIPVNIWDLGLIYGIEIEDNGDVEITMTLTAPGCPLASSITYMVQDKIKALKGVGDVKVNLVWDPPWSIEKLTEEGKKKLRELGYNV